MGVEYIIVNITFWFGLYLIVNLSLNLEYGYGGIPNFGKAFAVLIGAFALGGIINRLLIHLLGVSGQIIEASSKSKTIMNALISTNPYIGIFLFLFSIFLAFILGCIAGALFILPSAKLKEDYLAITLLAISEVVYFICYYNTDLIGGYYGVAIPDTFAFVPGEIRIFVFTAVVILVASLIYILLTRLLSTPYGRLLKAVRENEDVVRAYGKNIMTIKIKTVSLGSGVAAIAGALYSLHSVNVISSSFTRVEWTFYPFLMILLGGAGNNLGVVLGTFIFVLVKTLLTMYKFEISAMLNLPFEAVWLEYIMFGVVMLLILYYKPEGLVKEKPILTKPIKKVIKSRKERRLK